MKKLIIPFFLIIVSASCQQSGQKISIQDQETATSFASYGAEITSDDAFNILSLGEVMLGKDSTELKLSGTIEKTCKMKGCWMTVNTGDSTTMRVTFKNYGFFVPKDSMSGKTAIFEGKAFKSVTSVEMLRHFAQDEGKSTEEIKAITEPKEEYTFVATGVLIEEGTR